MSGYYEPTDEDADAFFRQAAKAEGLPYRVWCKKYGIVDAAALHRIEDNEISREAFHEGISSQFVSSEERIRAYKRQPGGLRSGIHARRRPEGSVDAAAE